jgi:drug/metabolite transporter (DMT)-like permease
VKYLLVLIAAMAIAIGIAAVVAGEADDSPGLQGLGVLLAVGAAVFGVRTVQRNR